MNGPETALEIGYLPAQLTKQDALAVLRRERFRVLKRLFHLRRAAPVIESRVQLIWMPHYLIDLEIESVRGTAIQRVTLDAYCAVFALWNIEDPPAHGVPGGESFPPRMDVSTATAKAAVALTNTTLHMRGQKGKPKVNRHTAIQLLYYPYWVCYTERRPGKYDIRIVDGAMGEQPGNQIKRAVLEAFIDASRRSQDESDRPAAE